MAVILTQTTEDYLKAIYELEERGQPATTTKLAERLDITPASVTGMLKRLARTEPQLIEYRKYRGAMLTPEGVKAALQVIRRHRLLESYLVSALGYSWDEVHQEACRLEHAISDTFAERIDEALGHPERDPHGDPIPDADCSLPAQQTAPLVSLTPRQRAVVRRIAAEDPALLRHIEDLRLLPGSRLEIVDYTELDQNLEIEVDGQSQTVIIGPAVSTQILVERTE
jgi:DtxR family Mn-dependent transcriptional regulator